MEACNGSTLRSGLIVKPLTSCFIDVLRWLSLPVRTIEFVRPILRCLTVRSLNLPPSVRQGIEDVTPIAHV